MTIFRHGPKTYKVGLDGLPSEVIQLIFDFCSDSNLPLASPKIAQQLSDERFYSRHAVDLLVVGTDTDERLDNAVTALLERRWMTWPMFQRVLQAAINQPVRTDPSEIVETSSDLVHGSDDTLHFTNPAEQMPLHRIRLGRKQLIPAKLLQGPWTTDKARFLYYLAWLGLRIDWENSTLGEVASRGLDQALAERNYVAVVALISRRDYVLPTTEHLRKAIVDQGCDITMVFHLLASAVRARVYGRELEMNFRDPAIWSWMRRFKTDNKKADWLRDALRYSADFASTYSPNDANIHAELVRAFGRLEDGVQQIEVPGFHIDQRSREDIGSN